MRPSAGLASRYYRKYNDGRAGFVLTDTSGGIIIVSSQAGVAKLVYALDSKSSGLNAHVGSSPTSGTIL